MLYEVITGTFVDDKRIYPKIPENKSERCLVLDGVFLCAKKNIFDKIHFDEKLEGFHCYDADICLQSNLAGFQNSIIFDIEIKHFSRGSFDKNYIQKLLKLHEKWDNLLPIFDNSISHKKIKEDLPKAERHMIGRLKKRLVRIGMKNNEIYPVISKCILSTSDKSIPLSLLTLNFHLHLIRITSILRNRITSYNVCYTKLLRFYIFRDRKKVIIQQRYLSFHISK